MLCTLCVVSCAAFTHIEDLDGALLSPIHQHAVADGTHAQAGHVLQQACMWNVHLNYRWLIFGSLGAAKCKCDTAMLDVHRARVCVP